MFIIVWKLRKMKIVTINQINFFRFFVLQNHAIVEIMLNGKLFVDNFREKLCLVYVKLFGPWLLPQARREAAWEKERKLRLNNKSNSRELLAHHNQRWTYVFMLLLCSYVVRVSEGLHTWWNTIFIDNMIWRSKIFSGWLESFTVQRISIWKLVKSLKSLKSKSEF